MSDDPNEARYPAGTQIGRYRLVRLLGEGGMGAVYEAVHADLGKRVAMKILRPEAARVPESRERFLREGRVAANLHHPHVAEVFDVGEADGALFLVMEYLEGQNLFEHLEEVGALTIARCADLLLPVCAALGVAHAAGVVHRDVKPENIFLARRHSGAVQPKLLDFGISKVAMPGGGRITAAANLLGTPHYMSPEQARQRGDVDARTDQYSLGVVLYECATGRRPFEGRALYAILHAITTGDAPPPRTLRPDMPAAFEAIVLRAMARHADDRFATMRELGRALLPFASPPVQEAWAAVFGGSVPRVTAAPTSEPARARPRAPWRAFATGATLALLILAAAFGALTWSRPVRSVASIARLAPEAGPPDGAVDEAVAAPPAAPAAPVRPALASRQPERATRAAPARPRAPIETPAANPPVAPVPTARGANRAPIVE